jgi:hypothetical protein
MAKSEGKGRDAHLLQVFHYLGVIADTRHMIDIVFAVALYMAHTPDTR